MKKRLVSCGELNGQLEYKKLNPEPDGEAAQWQIPTHRPQSVTQKTVDTKLAHARRSAAVPTAANNAKRRKRQDQAVHVHASIPSVRDVEVSRAKKEHLVQHIIGWSASAILVATIVTQIYRQWQQGSSKGVSKWLFIGQMTASAGFLAYSWLIHDLVFIFTNALMLLSALTGLAIVLWHRHRNPEEKVS